MDMKDFDSRLAENQMRVARINREAWKWQAPDPTGTSRIRRISIGITAIWRQAGMLVIHAGHRLHSPRPGTEARS